MISEGATRFRLQSQLMLKPCGCHAGDTHNHLFHPASRTDSCSSGRWGAESRTLAKYFHDGGGQRSEEGKKGRKEGHVQSVTSH
jgi:hypothetical protein